MEFFLWKTKLAAWIHDPAEKALVLLRDPAGHEGGTVRKLQQQLFPDGIPAAIKQHIHQADRWAAAADRPQFPQDQDSGWCPSVYVMNCLLSKATLRLIMIKYFKNQTNKLYCPRF
jgi:hypothetical protein